MPHDSSFVPTTTLLDLGAEFFDAVTPAKFPQLELRYYHPTLCDHLGWGAHELKSHVGEFHPVPGSLPQPLALRYHGHQFQRYNPELGDGRGFSFAQFREGTTLWELGTKGSGQTPYSRRGDGRLTLKGAFRESLATELLESLGVRTSRTLAFFETGEELVRGDEPSPTRSAVLTRWSHSHIRFGTFQRVTYLQQIPELRRLFDYVREHLVRPPFENAFTLKGDVTELFTQVIARTADLVAQWMTSGFVHGVLNTDNMNITGESFDYGPYRFLPHYDPGFTAAYFDETGLYAYGEQPHAVLWNLYQLGFCLRALEPAMVLDEIGPYYQSRLHDRVRAHLCRRLNVKSRGEDQDEALLIALFDFLAESRAPFEQTFFDFYRGRPLNPATLPAYTSGKAQELLRQWDDYDIANSAHAGHAYFQRTRPVTLLIEEIEALWDAVRHRDDWGPYQHQINEIRGLRGLYGPRPD